jgi:sugar phosphate isomerase/epimerase
MISGQTEAVPSQFPLSGFADEIDPSLDVQLKTLQELQIPGLDLRSVDGVNVLDLSTADLVRIKDACLAANIDIQSIGSPVNKVEYNVFAEARELDRLNKAIKAAQHLNCGRIRVFTPKVAAGKEEELGPKILDWMREQRNRAENQGVILIVENDDTYWNAFPDHAKRLFDTLGNSSFKAAFDFANTVLIGFRPMQDWFPWLLPHVDTLHIKDAVEADRRIVPAGGGDGQIQETLAWMVKQGWSGPLTIEPHLQAAGPFGGFSGPALFGEATKALRKIMAQVGVPA